MGWDGKGWVVSRLACYLAVVREVSGCGCGIGDGGLR